MTTTSTPPAAADLIAALLGGKSARYLRESIWMLSFDDYRALCCTLCCMHKEAAVECSACADEIDRLLASTNNGGPVINCRIYKSTSWCPLIEAAPTGFPVKANNAPLCCQPTLGKST
jgi:hypothetical protein